jgi:hypothetical protein
MHQSFVSVGRFRYALVAAVIALLCAGAYAIQALHGQPNGGTWLGYTLGTIAAVLILVLMGYGIRRRSFASRVGGASQWLSIHVYLGLCTLVVATLHCGFHFGANVHTLAYALLTLVVVSGCWGVYTYLRYPALLQKVRGNTGHSQLLTQVAALDTEALALAARVNQMLRELVTDAIRRTRTGGSIWSQLRGRDHSRLLLAPPFHIGYAHVVSNAGQSALIQVLAEQQANSRDRREREALDQLLKVTGEKAVLQRQAQRDIQLQGLMQFWLYLHLPLSFGLLAALAAHIFIVFFYR